VSAKRDGERKENAEEAENAEEENERGGIRGHVREGADASQRTGQGGRETSSGK